MKHTKITSKLSVLLTVIILTSCSSMRKQEQLKDDLPIVGSWVIEKSTVNGQDSPVPKKTTLKFTTDYQIQITIPKSSENQKEITGFGSWKKDKETIIITYDDKKLWGTKQTWSILKLTDKELEWEMETTKALQKELYYRKQ